MPIRFSILQDNGPEVGGDSIERLEGLGVSALILAKEERLTRNLEVAALSGAASHALTIHCAHWAGPADPPTAANQIAFLDQRLGGRLGLQIVEGPDGALGHEASWRRTDEYLTLLKRLWSNDKPIDHECEFYSVSQGYVASKGPQGALVPIRMTGVTGTAIQVCARHATVFDVAFGSYAEVAATVQKLRDAATRFGRANALSFALRIPAQAVVHTAGWSRTSDIRTISDFLQRYADIGIGEFVFDAAGLAGLGAARAGELRSALEGTSAEAPASLAHVRFAGFSRRAN